MTTTSNGDRLSRALWEARRDGRRIRVDDADRPRDEAGAYAVQRAGAEASGYEIAGFKIGATAQFAMDLLGVSGPFFGPLFREAFRENDATVSLPMVHAPGIESEFAVGLAADPPASGRAVDQGRGGSRGRLGGTGVRDCRHPPRERACRRRDARHRRRRRQHRLRVRPDRCGLAQRRPRRPPRHPAHQRAEAASGHSGMLVFGDPISGVAWLANHPELGARGLKAGDVVTTGTCTGITPLSPGDEAEADYGALGKVRARFSG